MRTTTLRAGVAGLCLGAALFAPAARAGLFDDDEARRAILDIRQKIEQNAERQRTGQQQLTEQIDQLKRSLLDLNNQLEQMRGDNASLRGQNEELTRIVSEIQRKQKDLQAGVDDRIRKIEPQKVSVDGKEFNADPEEKRQYDDAIELLRKSDFAGTANALSAFRRRWPASGYNESALFWLGNAQYGVRQYKEAITSFRTLVAGSPDHPKAPEALLAIANCQAELKDGKGARATIGELVKTYPKSEAAQAGRDRLASLK
ncbi:MAG TPA: tol-pal system protein YbgF [Burkholderiaceae bacterium]|nr:tol-pal system protein YbgF [Burkholderiaceae bacterium]